MGGGDGSVPTPPSLDFFLPFTQNILRQPIPKNSWPFLTLFTAASMNKNLNIGYIDILDIR